MHLKSWWLSTLKRRAMTCFPDDTIGNTNRTVHSFLLVIFVWWVQCKLLRLVLKECHVFAGITHIPCPFALLYLILNGRRLGGWSFSTIQSLLTQWRQTEWISDRALITWISITHMHTVLIGNQVVHYKSHYKTVNTVSNIKLLHQADQAYQKYMHTHKHT